MSTGKIPGAARDLEAYFLRRMLAEAKTGESGVFGSGFQGETFKEMLDEAVANKVSEAGGVGLAESIASELGPSYGTSQVIPAKRSVEAYRATSVVAGGIETSGFGPRRDPINGEHREHDGIDIGAELGSPVLAAKRGVVVRAESAGGYGNLVVVDHGGGMETRYAHLQDLKVRPGDHVEAGDAVGTVGESGRATGPHLHFEVRVDGDPIDPHSLGLKPLR